MPPKPIPIPRQRAAIQAGGHQTANHLQSIHHLQNPETSLVMSRGPPILRKYPDFVEPSSPPNKNGTMSGGGRSFLAEAALFDIPFMPSCNRATHQDAADESCGRYGRHIHDNTSTAAEGQDAEEDEGSNDLSRPNPNDKEHNEALQQLRVYAHINSVPYKKSLVVALWNVCAIDSDSDDDHSDDNDSDGTKDKKVKDHKTKKV
ncbi:hypothetical protein F503_01329 [Ophiostoma piceae UAMH 11346]|uniref:Uncharacterized protein n=1 Tax=Ophiostoma piceae (strain UAMH 11346) TaxID=1262450 RepID=S3CUE5_OPHP1|nr:hypothetical protein F503_01329 [Ophiostoma piceae UAMH 11346]